MFIKKININIQLTLNKPLQILNLQLLSINIHDNYLPKQF